MGSVARSIRNLRKRGRLYALTNFTTSNRYQTAGVGGVPPAVPFGVVTLYRAESLTGTLRTFATNRTAVSGWAHYMDASNDVHMHARDTAFKQSPKYRVTPTDLGPVHCSLVMVTATQLVHWHDRHKVGTATAFGTYTPAVDQLVFGSDAASTSPATSLAIVAELIFSGTPSDAQIEAFFDEVRKLGDLPTAFAGATIVHRWSCRDELAGTVVVDGQAGPASVRDTVTLLAADQIGKVGSPLVRWLDASTDGRKTYGVQGFTSTAMYRTTPGTGLVGITTGFTVCFPFRVHAGLGANRFLASHAVSTGWSYDVNAAGTSLRFVGWTAGAAVILPTYALSAGDLGKTRLLTMVFTGTNVETWIDGVQIGSTPCAGFSVDGAGYTAFGGSSSDGVAVFGLSGGHFAATPTQVAELYASWQRTGLVPTLPGFLHCWDTTLDVEANGGPDAGVPATSLDRIGTAHMTAGAGMTIAARIERTAGHEVRPIISGAEGLSTSHYWSVAGGFAGDPAGFMVEALVRVKTIAVGGAFRMFAAKRGNATPGWDLYTFGTMTAFAFALGGAAVGAAAPTAAITAADVGKLISLTGVWDATAGKVRLFVRRVEIGTGTTFAGPYTPAATAFTIGRRSDGHGADNVTLYGFRAGNFIPSAAEVHSAHDRLLLNERMTASDYPGRTLTNLYRFGSGAAPAVLSDLIGSAHLAVTGTPLIADQYAHNWGW
jgi:hypothetical protein